MNNTLDLIINQLDKYTDLNGHIVLRTSHLRNILVQVNMIENNLATKEFNKEDYILKTEAKDKASEAFVAGAKYAVSKTSISYRELYASSYEWIQRHII